MSDTLYTIDIGWNIDGKMEFQDIPQGLEEGTTNALEQSKQIFETAFANIKRVIEEAKNLDIKGLKPEEYQGYLDKLRVGQGIAEKTNEIIGKLGSNVDNDVFKGFKGDIDNINNSIMEIEEQIGKVKTAAENSPIEIKLNFNPANVNLNALFDTKELEQQEKRLEKLLIEYNAKKGELVKDSTGSRIGYDSDWGNNTKAWDEEIKRHSELLILQREIVGLQQRGVTGSKLISDDNKNTFANINKEMREMIGLQGHLQQGYQIQFGVDVDAFLQKVTELINKNNNINIRIGTVIDINQLEKEIKNFESNVLNKKKHIDLKAGFTSVDESSEDFGKAEATYVFNAQKALESAKNLLRVRNELKESGKFELLPDATKEKLNDVENTVKQINGHLSNMQLDKNRFQLVTTAEQGIKTALPNIQKINEEIENEQKRHLTVVQAIAQAIAQAQSGAQTRNQTQPIPGNAQPFIPRGGSQTNVFGQAYDTIVDITRLQQATNLIAEQNRLVNEGTQIQQAATNITNEAVNKHLELMQRAVNAEEAKLEISKKVADALIKEGAAFEGTNESVKGDGVQKTFKNSFVSAEEYKNKLLELIKAEKDFFKQDLYSGKEGILRLAREIGASVSEFDAAFRKQAVGPDLFDLLKNSNNISRNTQLQDWLVAIGEGVKLADERLMGLRNKMEEFMGLKPVQQITTDSSGQPLQTDEKPVNENISITTKLIAPTQDQITEMLTTTQGMIDATGGVTIKANIVPQIPDNITSKTEKSVDGKQQDIIIALPEQLSLEPQKFETLNDVLDKHIIKTNEASIAKYDMIKASKRLVGQLGEEKKALDEIASYYGITTDETKSKSNSGKTTESSISASMSAGSSSGDIKSQITAELNTFITSLGELSKLTPNIQKLMDATGISNITDENVKMGALGALNKVFTQATNEFVETVLKGNFLNIKVGRNQGSKFEDYTPGQYTPIQSTRGGPVNSHKITVDTINLNETEFINRVQELFNRKVKNFNEAVEATILHEIGHMLSHNNLSDKQRNASYNETIANMNKSILNTGNNKTQITKLSDYGAGLSSYAASGDEEEIRAEALRQVLELKEKASTLAKAVVKFTSQLNKIVDTTILNFTADELVSELDKSSLKTIEYNKNKETESINLKNQLTSMIGGLSKQLIFERSDISENDNISLFFKEFIDRFIKSVYNAEKIVKSNKTEDVDYYFRLIQDRLQQLNVLKD